jgi:hypothetical protein
MKFANPATTQKLPGFLTFFDITNLSRLFIMAKARGESKAKIKSKIKFIFCSVYIPFILFYDLFINQNYKNFFKTMK